MALQCHPGVGRQTKHAHDAHGSRDGRLCWVKLAWEHVPEHRDPLSRESIFLPAIRVEDKIALVVLRQIALDHLGDGTSVAHLPHCLQPTALAPPLVRVKGEVDRSRQHLLCTRLRNWRLDQCKIFVHWQAPRGYPCEKPLLIHVCPSPYR